jgi:hypothetical protein
MPLVIPKSKGLFGAVGLVATRGKPFAVELYGGATLAPLLPIMRSSIDEEGLVVPFVGVKPSVRVGLLAAVAELVLGKLPPCPIGGTPVE